MKLNITGVVILGLLLAAAIGALALGNKEIAIALATGALGTLSPSPVERQ